MPRGNGNGPTGMGPMTGRGMGYCAGNDAPGYASQYGFGSGFGGRRRGNRRMFYATGKPGWARYGAPANANFNSAFDAEADLRAEVRSLKEQLDQIDRRLSSLNNDAE